MSSRTASGRSPSPTLSPAWGLDISASFFDRIEDELGDLRTWAFAESRLLEECMLVPKAIGVPLDLDPDSDEVLDASEGDGDVSWVDVGIEAYCPLRLIRPCERANESGVVLLFH